MLFRSRNLFRIACWAQEFVLYCVLGTGICFVLRVGPTNLFCIACWEQEFVLCCALGPEICFVLRVGPRNLFLHYIEKFLKTVRVRPTREVGFQ